MPGERRCKSAEVKTRLGLGQGWSQLSDSKPSLRVAGGRLRCGWRGGVNFDYPYSCPYPYPMLRILLAVIGIISFSTTASAQARPQRILFVGNSLTSHGPKADIDWHGNWGMAATSLDKDYVHVVTKALATKQGTTPVIMVKNVADFERAHVGYDIAGKFADAAAFKADLIILCIGENVAALKTPEAQSKYQEQVTALLKMLRSNPKAQIIVRSSFWANPAKDTAMRQACETVGGTFVDISALSKDEKNYARSERPYKHAGVANHPGDRGMAAIAEEIVKVVK